MNLVTCILAGACLGGAASALTGINNLKWLVLNVATGVAGVMGGGWLLRVLIGASAFSSADFGLASLLVSLMGAAILLAALQLSRGVAKNKPLTGPDAAAAAFDISKSVNRHQSENTGMNKTLGAGRSLRPLITAGLAGILMLVGACASTPPAPDSALNAARVAILNAEKAEAGRYAGAELGEAREKLALADRAVGDEDMVAAGRLAEESRVQAELASARTAASKAAAVNKDMERGADALAEELQRAAGEPR